MAVPTPATVQLPDTFYRVSAKAIIFDDKNRLLLFKDKNDDLIEARFVTHEEFLQLPFESDEKAVVEYVDQIWSEA